MSKQALEHYKTRYPALNTIYSEGEAGATMYIVQSGKVRLFRIVEGLEREIGVMEKGDLFGETAVLEGLPRPTSAQALEDAELIEINGATFEKMIRGNIEIAVRLLRKLSTRLRETERRNAELQVASGPAPIHTPQASAPMPETGRTAARLESEDVGQVFAVRADGCTLGRFDPVTGHKPDINLTELDLKRSVSRTHARVARDGTTWTLVEEEGTLNGTFVNGERLTSGEPRELADGDGICIGTVKLRFHA